MFHHDAAESPPRLSPPGLNGLPGESYGPPPRNAAMRRRLKVFVATFLLGLLATLVYDFGRSPIYKADARIQITPAARAAASSPAGAEGGPQGFGLEVQLLSSRPLLEAVLPRLQAAGHLRETGGDSVAQLQRMLTLLPVPGTQVVELQAEGPQPALTAALLNTLIEVYRERQLEAGDASQLTQLDDAREELRVIEARVQQQRRALDSFRQRANIVSAERDENQTLSRLKGIGASLNTVNEREAAAAGKVHAIEQAIAEGKRTPQARDNPTIAGIENRLSQNREEWRSLERQYTPQYLELDPAARSLKSRIANLEQQLETERRASQQTALADAREELRMAQVTGQRLQQQLVEDRQGVQAFGRRFAEHQGLQEELAGLEKLQQAAKQKLLALEAGERTRRPRVEVLEHAVVPQEPWRPSYWRDAGFGLVMALLLGLLAVWFIEFFDRRDPRQGPTVVIAPSWGGMPAANSPQLAGAMAPALPHGFDLPRLGQALEPLRELEQEEVARLLAHAAPEPRAMLACLLCGLSVDEVVALPLGAVDAQAGQLRLRGDSPRELVLPPLLRGWAARRGEQTQHPEAPLFVRPGGQTPIDAQDVRAAVTSSALDAELDQPQTVSAESLRHSHIAFLLRQGLRFGELAPLVGRLPPETLSQLAALAPGGPRLSRDQVEPLMPALRRASLS
ncbi:hypothetical protein G8A07_04700 [Roseateles sp. DAIF2]|uniref:GumC family protein n=1 Tax=Roseateles sp. DAIF2 TaxID=2714952 RepID=UPI0018A29B84|nr:Wzz/FepE/Etk N-terminal domain-containing protein [Roseateles sp. DAIF2]QPF72299.1 hypothetical protein G8A07_04700 [Roseateles sp. DAIF2]